MKIRSGFVSNSSSSSFVCNVCGTAESGYDASLEDMGFKNCSNGHEFCKGHAIADVAEPDLEAKRMLLLESFAPNIERATDYYKEDRLKVKNFNFSKDEDVDEFEVWWSDHSYDIGGNPAACPLCQFKDYDNSEVIPYLLHKLSWSKQDLLNNIKEDHTNYASFQTWLKEQREKEKK